MKALLSAEEKERCVIQYRNKKNISELVSQYGISERTIRRWNSVYDGTIESLSNGSHIPLTPHPQKMPLWEEKLLIDIVNENPAITDKQLSEKLGTNRSPSVLHRKREKLFGKRHLPCKYDYETIFSKERVDEINKIDANRGKIPRCFFAISILPDLYLRVNTHSYPVCVTPYFSVALKFLKREDAENFLAQILCHATRWVPKIIQVCNGSVIDN